MSNVPQRAFFTDPVHGTLDFGTQRSTKDLLKGLIDSTCFQRLRRISQLGLASYVFPGATHTRFAHGLGAAYLARLVVQHLQEWHDDHSNGLGREMHRIICAALLHDIGHGPFSHSFERASAGIRDGDGKPPEHEAWTRLIIREKLAPILAKSNVDAESVASLFEHSDNAGEHTYLKSIVSSQLDVDRLDYLLRDAYFAGVALGQVDMRYLVKEMVLIPHGTTVSIGVSEKGVRAYEAFAMARHFMNRSVYFHPKVKVLEFMMEECLRRALLDKTGSRNIVVPPYLRALASRWNDLEDFMAYHLTEYLALTEDHVWVMIHNLEARATPAGMLARRILRREVLDHYLVQPGKSDIARKLEEHFGRDACRIVNLESVVYKDKPGEDLFVLSKNGSIRHIRELSFTISVLGGRPESDTLLVVLDKKKKKAIEDAAKDMQCIRSGLADEDRRPKALRGTRARGSSRNKSGLG